MGLLKMADRGSYINKNAVENVIHYITRSRKNEDRRDSLICYGGFGIGNYLEVDDIIKQILYVQNIYRIDSRGGRRMYHEIYLISDSEYIDLVKDMYHMQLIAAECAKVYFYMGFQVVYAIHWEKDKRLHIHFAVNTINLKTGKKWHSSMTDTQCRNNLFDEIVRKYLVSRWKQQY